jgi:amino acid transporter
MLFGLAAHGDAPRSLVALDSRRVPTRAILIGTVFGYLAVLASVASPQRLFTFLVNASGAIMLVIYLLIALAQIRLFLDGAYLTGTKPPVFRRIDAPSARELEALVERMAEPGDTTIFALWPRNSITPGRRTQP